MSRCGDKLFKHKCLVTWCENVMTPFQFEVGHNLPESKGGPTELDNLRPICGKCNRSMGDEYTIDEFSTQRDEAPLGVLQVLRCVILAWVFFWKNMNMKTKRGKDRSSPFVECW